MAKFAFNLADIDETNGFLIRGIKIDPLFQDFAPVTGNNFSFTIASPKGDFNGDGIDDLLIESTVFLNNGNSEQETYLILGNNNFAQDFNVANLDGTNGLTIKNTDSVISTTSFSDLNNDQKDDLLLIVGDLLGETRNLVNYNIFGNDNPPAIFDITDINGENGFSVIDNNLSLVSFFFEKNINDDEFQDLAFIGTSESGEIRTKVIFGNSSYPVNFDISVLDGNNGFVVEGQNIITGGSIDVNQDGVGDLAFIDNTSPTIHILFGSNNFPATVDLKTLDGNNGFSLTETGINTSDRLVGGLLEDINGDGLGEIIVEKSVAEEEGGELEPNKVYVVFGQDEFTANFDLTSVDGSNGFEIDAPIEIEGIIDFNGDNLQDIIFDDTVTEGNKYVLFGSSNGYGEKFDLNSLDGTNGFVIENLSGSFQDRGDINGDGLDDAIFETVNNTTYVVFASDKEFEATLDVENSEANVLAIDSTDTAISSVLDINNDQKDDLVFSPVLDTESADGTATSSVLLGSEKFSDSLDVNINRFQNNDISGTYLFANEEESKSIRENFPNFSEEGLAFKVSDQPGNGLIPLYRFQSLITPGTYLFAGQEERESIKENFSDAFTEEGLAFYVYGAGTGLGREFIRFQNSDRPGTYLFAGQEEAESIIKDFPNFLEEGVAFEVL
ncbi:MAG: hypothetical protein QNJ60_11440 [Xenococcaceae cyanobacterium MO_188.B19]|nr:hypothetical protein [Xenococcaceae cyanobacterium MO_188.B19]